MPDVSQAFQDDPRFAHLEPKFAASLQALMRDQAANGNTIGIKSGYRDEQQQAALWQAALQKYGSPAVARKWVAPPGHSNHNAGLAVDLSFGGPESIAAVHAAAANYGLNFPLANENWHIEPVGIRNHGAAPPAPAAPLAAMASLAPPRAPAAAPANPGVSAVPTPASAPPAAPPTAAPAPSNPYSSLAAIIGSAAPQLASAPPPEVPQAPKAPARDPAAIARALTQGLAGNLTLA